MPFKTSSNNRVLPSNARASDVVSRAIQEIVPVQQSRNYSAHRVQGYKGLLYNRLYQGPKCSCQSSEQKINSRLNLEGKADAGFINELLTGQMEFTVTPYGRNLPSDVVSPFAPQNKNQGVFDIISKDGAGVPSRVETQGFGDNGALEEFDINDLAGAFDASSVGMTDVYCAVCFGTGFVGGYSVFHGHRSVIPVDQVDLGSTSLNLIDRPWSAESKDFSFQVLLPRGAVALDICRVMNNKDLVVANFTIDSQAVNEITILKFCDGRPHLIEVNFSEPRKWTHVELQFALASDHAYFELPKTNKGSDISLLEQTEPFQISMASNVPNLQPEDLIVESSMGRVLMVQNSNGWNTRRRDLLGWECNVRPVQPQELYNILPRRGRIRTKDQTALGAHDNMYGTART